MDCNILSNYRPVSNLTFVSEIIEITVTFQLNKYLINNNLNESLQSGYESGQNTVTMTMSMINVDLSLQPPEDIKNASTFENFKSVIKTHLFKVAFTDK